MRWGVITIYAGFIQSLEMLIVWGASYSSNGQFDIFWKRDKRILNKCRVPDHMRSLVHIPLHIYELV